MAEQKKNRVVKGVDARNEVDPNKMYRDSRTTYQKFSDFMYAEGGLIVIFMLTSIVLLESLAALAGGRTFGISIFLVIFLPLFKKRGDKIVVLPFKKPQTSGEMDINELNPATNMPSKAKGISFYGNEMSTKDQIWFANDDVRTHCLIFGTTGAGKTETLLSICMNSLIHASGFIYVDGKGDNSLFLKVFSMVRRMGREDDLLLINYMTGTVDTTKKTFDRLSNTMNPFNSGSADALTELIVSLLPSGGGDGMWKGRAAIFMSALMRVLVSLRNDRKIMLDVDTIRKHFSLEKLEELIERDDVLDIHKDGLQDYVWNLPGYVKKDPAEPNKKIEQDFGVFEQHGFITMQYTEAFGLLSDTYGHIMKTQLAEVDFYDVVVNRRILVVLLPALEKSTQSLGNLGKIVVASVRAMMAQALGSKVEGNKEDVVDAKPTNSPSPYTTVFDEWGYYAVEGAAVMPAQARSLGFAMIFAGQDYQAFKKGSAEEAASIVANCAVKICMKLEDPTETLEIFTKAAGEATVNVSSGSQLDKQSTMGGYVDSGNASITSKARIVGRDLKDQIAGESHILFGDTFVRAKMFYAAPKQVKNLRLNKFLKVPMPEYSAVKRITLGYNRINRSYLNFLSDEGAERIEELNVYLKNNAGTDDMNVITNALNATKDINNLQQRAIFALHLHNKKQNIIDAKMMDDKEAIDEIHKSKGEFVEDKGHEIKTRAEAAKEINVELDFSPSGFDSDVSFDVREESSKSVKDVTKNRSITKKESAIDKLREKTQDKYIKNENNLDNKYSPYKIMGMEVNEIRESFKDVETALSKCFIDQDFIDSDERGEKGFSEVVTEKVFADISGSLTYASEVKLNKVENTKETANHYVEDILIRGIDRR